MNRKIENLERAAETGFQANSKYTTDELWQEKILLNIKREEARKREKASEWDNLLKPCLFWKFTLASAFGALLICLISYFIIFEFVEQNDNPFKIGFEITNIDISD